MWPFKKKVQEVPVVVEPPKETVVAATVARPVVLNPTVDQATEFALYRSDAIARDIEQRRTARLPQNKDHDAMVHEALAYGHALVGAKVWVDAQFKSLERRVKGL